MIRLFAAIAVPEEIAEGLARRQQGVPGARWRSPDGFHITLRFAGDISEALADDFDAALSGVGGVEFEVGLAGAGSFGDGADIRAVWAGVADSAPLRRLASRCEIAARRAGLRPETRAWKPHVTLAYLTRPDPAPVAAWIQSHNLMKSPPFWVSAFGLYSSWSADRGSVYRLERSYPLDPVGTSASVPRR
jgi:2'-5' RNA ligase